MRSLTRRMLLAAVALLTFEGRAMAADDVDETLDGLTGKYRFSGGAKERKALNDAIEGVVKELNPIVRRFARKRLRQANKIPERMRIARSGNNLTVKLDGRTYTAPINGGSVKVRGITGETVELSYVVGGGRIKQRFVGDAGGRDNVFRRHDDKHVRMAVRVHSEKLPKDLHYRLTYRER